MAGCDSSIKDVSELILSLKHPEVYSKYNIKPPRGILLHGPPGCGKTMLANAIAGVLFHFPHHQIISNVITLIPHELKIPIIEIVSTELVARVSGKSEERISNVFDKAVSIAPSILFFDGIDIVMRKLESAEREMEVRVFMELAACLDGLNSKDAKPQVLVLAAANHPDSIDGPLRRRGRFYHEVNVPIPNKAARTKLLTLLCTSIRMDPDVDYDKLAKLTSSFVGADLSLLVQRTSTINHAPQKKISCLVNQRFQINTPELKKTKQTTSRSLLILIRPHVNPLHRASEPIATNPRLWPMAAVSHPNKLTKLIDFPAFILITAHLGDCF